MKLLLKALGEAPGGGVEEGPVSLGAVDEVDDLRGGLAGVGLDFGGLVATPFSDETALWAREGGERSSIARSGGSGWRSGWLGGGGR